MVRTFLRRKGENHSKEINLDDYNVTMRVEMIGGHMKVKGLDFQRKEDKE